MNSSAILVLGATGPAGICVLREALYRQRPTIAYVRNASKIPDDLRRDSLLEVIEGRLEDTEKLGAVVARATVIISLLGPGPSVPADGEFPFAGYYSAIFLLMRKSHSAKRILAMGTAVIYGTEDRFSFIVSLISAVVRFTLPAAHRTILGIHQVFQKEANGLDWTIFRLSIVRGDSDEASWKRDRQDATFAGPIGTTGWTWYIRRGGLAKWLVDQAEEGISEALGRIPAVSYSAT